MPGWLAGRQQIMKPHVFPSGWSPENSGLSSLSLACQPHPYHHTPSVFFLAACCCLPCSETAQTAAVAVRATARNAYKVLTVCGREHEAQG